MVLDSNSHEGLDLCVILLCAPRVRTRTALGGRSNQQSLLTLEARTVTFKDTMTSVRK